MKPSDIAWHKSMPHSLEAERAVLGAIMLDQEALHGARSVIGTDAFYSEGHQVLFEKMLTLKAIDLVTLKDALDRSGQLEKAGGIAYVASLTDGMPAAVNVEHYARIVKSKAALRRLIEISNSTMQRCFADEEAPETILESVQQDIFASAGTAGEGEFHPVERLMHQTYKGIEERSAKKQMVTGVPTGFFELDRRTTGLHPGELIIVAGRPGEGKTTLAMNIIANAAIRHKRPAAIFSLEMSKEQLMDRFTSAEARVDSRRIATGHMTREDWARLGEAANRIAEAKIYINDSSSLTMGDVFAKAHRLHAEKKFDLLVVDYLQLMRSGVRSENRTQEVTAISRGLKALAKDLKIPVIAVSQLNRAVEGSGKRRRPVLSDLRESGSIEQDADAVIFIHRPGEGEDADKVEIILEKQRNGPTGSFDLAFMRCFTRFETIFQEGEGGSSE